MYRDEKILAEALSERNGARCKIAGLLAYAANRRTVLQVPFSFHVYDQCDGRRPNHESRLLGRKHVPTRTSQVELEIQVRRRIAREEELFEACVLTG